MKRLESEEIKRIGVYIDLENVLRFLFEEQVDEIKIKPKEFENLLENIIDIDRERGGNLKLVIVNCYHSANPKKEEVREFFEKLREEMKDLGIFNIITIPRKHRQLKVSDEEEKNGSFILNVSESDVDLKLFSDLDDVILDRVPARIDILWLVSGDKHFKEALKKAMRKGIKVRVASFPESLSREIKKLVGRENCYNFGPLLIKRRENDR